MSQTEKRVFCVPTLEEARKWPDRLRGYLREIESDLGYPKSSIRMKTRRAENNCPTDRDYAELVLLGNNANIAAVALRAFWWGWHERAGYEHEQRQRQVVRVLRVVPHPAVPPERTN